MSARTHPFPRPIVLASVLAAMLCTTAAAGTPRYRLALLDVPGGSDVRALDMNDAGEVVGDYIDADFDMVPVYWDAAGVAHRLAVPGVGDGSAAAIDARGEIVGTFADYVNAIAGVIWNTATPEQYALLSDDTSINVVPTAINDAGVVVGGAGLPAAARAFVWTAETGLVDYGLEDENEQYQQARWLDVNASGTLVGSWSVHSSDIHAAVGTVGTPAVLPIGEMAAEFPSVATAVNAAGTVVGLGLAVAAPELVPVVFAEDGSFEEIPGATLDQQNGCASAINDAGVIGGSAGIGSASGCVPGLRAWLYVDGEVHDLADLVDDDAGLASFSKVAAIAASGALLGAGLDADGRMRYFVATPTADEAIFADGFDG